MHIISLYVCIYVIIFTHIAINTSLPPLLNVLWAIYIITLYTYICMCVCVYIYRSLRCSLSLSRWCNDNVLRPKSRIQNKLSLCLSFSLSTILNLWSIKEASSSRSLSLSPLCLSAIFENPLSLFFFGFQFLRVLFFIFVSFFLSRALAVYRLYSVLHDLGRPRIANQRPFPYLGLIEILYIYIYIYYIIHIYIYTHTYKEGHINN